ncbi:MAG: TSUP family transporter [Planctomycetota bacterium]
MSALEVCGLALAVYLTATLSAIVGMAGGMTLLVVMLQWLDPMIALPLHGAVQLVSNGARTAIQREHVDWGIVGRFGLLLLPAGYVGLVLARSLDRGLLLAAIGVMVLAVTLRLGRKVLTAKPAQPRGPAPAIAPTTAPVPVPVPAPVPVPVPVLAFASAGPSELSSAAVALGPSAAEVALGPSAAEVALGPSAAEVALGPSAAEVALGPSAAEVALGPSAAEVALGPSAAEVALGPSAAEVALGPSAAEVALGPSSAAEGLSREERCSAAEGLSREERCSAAEGLSREERCSAAEGLSREERCSAAEGLSREESGSAALALLPAASRSLAPADHPRAAARGLRFVLLGAGAGALNTSVGATGPFIAPFFLDLGLERRELIGTKAACQCSGHLAKLLIFGAAGFAFGPFLPVLALLGAVAVAGTWTGSKILERVSEAAFTRVYLAVLLLLGARLVAKGLL